MAANAGHGLHTNDPYRGMPDRARIDNSAIVIQVDDNAPLAVLYGQMSRMANACQSRWLCFEGVREVLVLVGLGLVLDILQGMSMQQ